MKRERQDRRYFGLVSAGVMLIGVSPILSQAPYVGALGILTALVGVILLLVVRSRMSDNERKPFHYSIVSFLIALIVVIIGISFNLGIFLTSIQSGQEISVADIERFIKNITPFLIPAIALVNLSYLLLPFGLATKGERYLLIASFAVSLSLSILLAYFLYTGYSHITTSQSPTSALTNITGLSNQIISRILGIPGAVLWFVSYLLIGLRLHNEQRPNQSDVFGS